MDLAFWQTEWDAVKAAPVPAIVALVLAFLVGYWVRRAIGAGQIEGLKAHLDAKDERLQGRAEDLEKRQALIDKLNADLTRIEEQQRKLAEAAGTKLYGKVPEGYEAATASARTSIATLSDWNARDLDKVQKHREFRS
jgi:chromosome segregation ATPase